MRKFCALILMLCACSKGSPRASWVHASATAHGIEVTWASVSGASSYRVQLVDLDVGEAVGDAVHASATQATLPGAYSRALGVWVDAQPGERAYGVVSAGAGDGSAWQLFAPQEFHGGELHVKFAALDPSERLGVLLVNAGGADDAAASVRIDGVQSPEAATSSPVRTALMNAVAVAQAPPVSLHEQVRAAQDEAPASVAAAETVSSRTSFCVVPGLEFAKHVRRPATLQLATAHAEFYVDDDDVTHYPASFLPALGQMFEDRVFGPVTGVFGAPTDVDGNGKLLVVLSHELGDHLNGGWLIGYFGNADLSGSRDDSAGCSDGGSNHGEIIYLNDIANGAANGWTADDLANSLYPETVAHEMQHMLNFGHRCVEKKCDSTEATWINEALSKVAEDVAGFGWNAQPGRAAGTAYLSHGSASVRGYDGRSLTRWEGDPIGNYQGAHSFLRFFTDRLGPSFAGGISTGAGGVSGLETVLGRPLARAMAEWATALLLSNESGAPYSFSGTGWSPLHERLRYLDTSVPGTATLRTDGIAAVASGAGTGAAAEVVVRSTEAVPPHVVVVRYAAQVPAR